MAISNDDLAASVGQDKPHKDGCYAYDQKHGTYSPKPMPNRNLDQSESTVQPFGPMKEGR